MNASFCAHDKGWTLVKSRTVPATNRTVTLCRIDNDVTPFAVHVFNPDNGEFYWGDYCADYYSADRAYSRKLANRS